MASEEIDLRGERLAATMTAQEGQAADRSQAAQQGQVAGFGNGGRDEAGLQIPGERAVGRVVGAGDKTHEIAPVVQAERLRGLEVGLRVDRAADVERGRKLRLDVGEVHARELPVRQQVAVLVGVRARINADELILLVDVFGRGEPCAGIDDRRERAVFQREAGDAAADEGQARAAPGVVDTHDVGAGRVGIVVGLGDAVVPNHPMDRHLRGVRGVADDRAAVVKPHRPRVRLNAGQKRNGSIRGAHAAGRPAEIAVPDADRHRAVVGNPGQERRAAAGNVHGRRVQPLLNEAEIVVEGVADDGSVVADVIGLRRKAGVGDQAVAPVRLGAGQTGRRQRERAQNHPAGGDTSSGHGFSPRLANQKIKNWGDDDYIASGAAGRSAPGNRRRLCGLRAAQGRIMPAPCPCGMPAADFERARGLIIAPCRVRNCVRNAGNLRAGPK